MSPGGKLEPRWQRCPNCKGGTKPLAANGLQASKEPDGKGALAGGKRALETWDLDLTCSLEKVEA